MIGGKGVATTVDVETFDSMNFKLLALVEASAQAPVGLEASMVHSSESSSQLSITTSYINLLNYFFNLINLVCIYTTLQSNKVWYCSIIFT